MSCDFYNHRNLNSRLNWGVAPSGLRLPHDNHRDYDAGQADRHPSLDHKLQNIIRNFPGPDADDQTRRKGRGEIL